VAEAFKLDPKHRLGSVRATHFALPPDSHLQIDRPRGAVVRVRYAADVGSALQPFLPVA